MAIFLHQHGIIDRDNKFRLAALLITCLVLICRIEFQEGVGVGKQESHRELLLINPYNEKLHVEEGKVSATKTKATDDYSRLSNPPGICISNLDDLPDKWKPPSDLIFQDKEGYPWSEEEREMALEASHKGLEELITFYDRISTKRIIALGGDAANSLIDQCYASAHDPPFHNTSCHAAASVVILLAQDMIGRDGFCNSCHDTKGKSKLLAYANYLSQALLPYGDNVEILNTRNALVPCVQATLDACGSLQNYLGGHHWRNHLHTLETPRRTIRDYVHHANRLVDLYLIPELILFPDLDQFISQLWKDYLPKYSFLNVPYDYYDSESHHHAFLVTHAAYNPTGYGRHMQYLEDAPWLYEYIRNNFYAALQQGSMDLFSEFADIIRQYGCTRENDYMLRLGTRYLLNMYVANNRTWMKDADGDDWEDDYNRIHTPWTTISGVATKQFEPIVPGSYGYAFRKALKRAAAAAANDND